MYVLTEKRLATAKPILEKYRGHLIKNGAFDAIVMERELRDALGLGKNEFKDIMCDVLKKHTRYRLVAAYYMQNSNAPGVVSEFQERLAELYGAKAYNSAEYKVKQQKFWDKALRGKKSPSA